MYIGLAHSLAGRGKEELDHVLWRIWTLFGLVRARLVGARHGFLCDTVSL
jgi:hypothetical protein